MFNKFTLYVSVLVPLAGAMSACDSESSTTDIIEQGTGVTFTAREASRTTLISNSTISQNSFAVYGDMVPTASASTDAPTVVFDGNEVIYGNGAWSYANPQYWFPGHIYSFVALYPATYNNVSDLIYQDSRLSFTYTQPDDYTRAIDLLIANHRRRYTAAGNGSTVAFDFRHLMSRLDFVANVDPSIGTGSVTIDSITLRGVNTKAIFSIIPASLSNGQTQTIDYSEGSWTGHSMPDTIFTLTPALTLPKTDNNGTAYSEHLFPNPSDPLLIIPQDVPADVEVKIDYTRITEGSNPQRKTVVSKLFTTSVTAHNGVWEPAKSYTYTFTIGVDDLIIFSSPTVQGWSESEGGNYII